MKRKVLIGGLAAVAAVVVAAFVFVVSGGLDRTTTARPRGAEEQVVTVELVDSYAWFDITPDVIEVAADTELVLDVVNRAGGMHDLEVAGQRTRLLEPGESQRLELGVITESLHGRCTVSDHDSAGMTLDIRVV
jgi:nitrite reductase (NO-forming)